jgi:hypothetical protein
VTAALQRYLRIARVSPFMGVGGGFSTTSTEGKTVVNTTGGTQTVTKNATGGQAVGTLGTFAGGSTLQGFGFFGFEFFLTNEISFSAEYRLGIAKTSRKDEEQTAGPTTTTTKVGGQNLIGIGSSAQFTMAVYLP